MNKHKIFGNSVLALGLMVAGTTFAADTAQTPEQRTEMKQTREQKMEQNAAKDGTGERKQHREMKQERVHSDNMRGSGSSRAR